MDHSFSFRIGNSERRSGVCKKERKGRRHEFGNCYKGWFVDGDDGLVESFHSPSRYFYNYVLMGRLDRVDRPQFFDIERLAAST